MAGAMTPRHKAMIVGATIVSLSMGTFTGTGFFNRPIAAEFGVGVGTVLIYFTLFQVTGAVMLASIGPVIINRLGTRLVIIILGTWVALALAAASLAQNVWWLYGCGVAIGLGFNLIGMQPTLLVNTWFEARKGTILGIVLGIGMLAGAFLGIAMPIVRGFGSWRTGFVALAIYYFCVTVVPAIFLIRDRPQDVGLLPYGAEPPADGAGDLVLPGVTRTRALRSRQLWAIVAALFLHSVTMGVFQNLIPMAEIKGHSTALAGTLMTVSAIGMVICTMSLGVLTDVKGPAFVVALGVGTLILSLIGFVVFDAYPGLAVSVAAMSIGVSMIPVLLPILVFRVFGARDYNGIFSTLAAAMPLGMGVGAPVWGAIYDATGTYDAASILSAVAIAVVGFLFIWAIRTGPGLRQRVQDEDDLGRALGDP